MTNTNSSAVDDFIRRHALPESFRTTITKYYEPLAGWLVDRLQQPSEPFLLGVSGAQGSGKSTLAEYLAMALSRREGTVAVLSLDDFYLTRAERNRLADEVHPLLRTRGVPGTHDMVLLQRHIEALGALQPGETLLVPRFDKAADDRAPESAWTRVSGPLTMIILEGWCVGARPQTETKLAVPVNALERDEDSDGEWRRYVNVALTGAYADLNAQLGALVYLRIPGFDSVFGWRLEQERKLAAGAQGDHVMSEKALARFILHYERLTRANQDVLPQVADVVLRLGEDHNCLGMSIRQIRDEKS